MPSGPTLGSDSPGRKSVVQPGDAQDTPCDEFIIEAGVRRAVAVSREPRRPVAAQVLECPLAQDLFVLSDLPGAESAAAYRNAAGDELVPSNGVDRERAGSLEPTSAAERRRCAAVGTHHEVR